MLCNVVVLLALAVCSLSAPTPIQARLDEVSSAVSSIPLTESILSSRSSSLSSGASSTTANISSVSTTSNPSTVQVTVEPTNSASQSGQVNTIPTSLSPSSAEKSSISETEISTSISFVPPIFPTGTVITNTQTILSSPLASSITESISASPSQAVSSFSQTGSTVPSTSFSIPSSFSSVPSSPSSATSALIASTTSSIIGPSASLGVSSLSQSITSLDTTIVSSSFTRSFTTLPSESLSATSAIESSSLSTVLPSPSLTNDVSTSIITPSTTIQSQSRSITDIPTQSLSSVIETRSSEASSETNSPPSTQPPVSSSTTTSSAIANSSPTGTTSNGVSLESSQASSSASPTRTRLPFPFPKPSTGPAEIAAYLGGHNGARAQHGAEPLTWSSSLAESATGWAEACKFSHTNGALGPYGDNIAAGTGIFTAGAAVSRFTDELYDPKQPQLNHLTQVIWKNTTEVGCGVGVCDNIFPKSAGPTTLHVCLYNPVGNVVGQERDNLQ